MNIYNPEHRHHKVWKEFTESTLTGTPLELQLKMVSAERWIDSKYKDVFKFSWSEDFEYRIKPNVNQYVINDEIFECVIPFSGELSENQNYWIANFNGLVTGKKNYNPDCGVNDVNTKRVHLRQAAAEAHAKVIQAMLLKLSIQL